MKKSGRSAGPGADVDVYLNDVTKAYSDEAPAVSHANLTIHRGEFVFITGKTGSGKSTLLKLIQHELKPTQGEIWVLQYDLNRIPHHKVAKFRRSIGIVFQDFRLLKDRNVYDNVAFAQQVLQIPKDSIHKNVLSILNMVGMSDKYKRKVTQLSGGEQQRVALARAVVNMPFLLLADEPTGNLDSKTAWEIMKLIERVNTEMGRTVIVVTHDQNIVRKMHKRVIVMDKGEIISDTPADGQPSETEPGVHPDAAASMQQMPGDIDYENYENFGGYTGNSADSGFQDSSYQDSGSYTDESGLQLGYDQYQQGYDSYGRQPGYDQSQPGYSQQPGYDQSQPGYSQQPDYDLNQPGYGQNQPDYDQNQPGYDPSQAGYGQPQDYNQYQPGYDQYQQGYDSYSQQPDYDRNQPGYGQNQPAQPDYSQQPDYDRNQPYDQAGAAPKDALDDGWGSDVPAGQTGSWSADLPYEEADPEWGGDVPQDGSHAQTKNAAGNADNMAGSAGNRTGRMDDADGNSDNLTGGDDDLSDIEFEEIEDMPDDAQ